MHSLLLFAFFANDAASVSLARSWATDADLHEIARMPNLARLDLSYTRITDRGLLYLRSAKNLEEVDLSFAEQLGDPCHAAIREWKKLRRITLRGTRVADITAAVIAALPEVEAADLSYSDMSDVGLDSLTTAPKLRELNLGGTRISETGFLLFRQMPGLTKLDLGGVRPIGLTPLAANDAGFEAIASLPSLRELRLGPMRLSRNALEILSRAPRLEWLGLEFCDRVDDEMLADLAKFPALKRVDLHGTKASAERVAELRKQLPRVRILYE